jgi:hypothetical protein
VERKRRRKSKKIIVLAVISQNQKAPVVLGNFGASSVSKTAFQAFYVEWLTANYEWNNTLSWYTSMRAVFQVDGRASPCPRLDCTHEGADDRMMFHIQDI